MEQPHQHAVPVYGAKIQYAKLADTSPKLGDKYNKFVQQVTGTFLYYARAVDATMLLMLSAIASEQAAPTAETTKKTLRFLDYVTTDPGVIITFVRSSMILNVHSDAMYLCKPKVKSRAGGHVFLSDNAKDPRDNGTVLNIAKIMKDAMSSAAEAEIGALFFLNSRQAIPSRTTLMEMGHPQPQTTIQTDRTYALGFVGKTMTPKAVKPTDMKH